MNYQEFIQQLKRPQNYILTRYFKSFLTEFNKKEWKRSQHHRIIADFVNFITPKTVETLQLSKTDNALFISHQLQSETFHKHWKALVEQKLYDKLFALPSEQGTDECIKQKCLVLSQFLRLEHFTTAKISLTSSILQLISSEFSSMSLSKTSAEKLVHVVNGCKLLLSFLSANSVDLINLTDESGEAPQTNATITIDEYLPVLIYILIMKYPPNLYLNLAFIENTSPDISGECAYYFTNLMSAIHYIQSLDGTTLHCDIEWYWINYGIYAPIPPSPPPPLPEKKRSFRSHSVESSNGNNSANSSPSKQGTLTNVFSFLSKYVPSTTSLTNSSSSPSRPSTSRHSTSIITPTDNSNVPSVVSATFNTPNPPVPSGREEEEFELQLAMALSLSEQESDMYNSFNQENGTRWDFE